MASYNKNIQLGVVDANGDIYVLYPQSKAANITVDVGSSGYLHDNNLTDVQAALVKMGADIAAGSVPTNHAATDLTYGGGTDTNYGHVKLSDNYTSSAGAASASIGASSKAVYDCYSACAPKSHATTATTYGGGTSSNYGHVKVSDNYTSSAGAASASVAASSKAVYDTYTYALNRITYGTTDYTAGSTALTTGNVYLYYT